MSDLEFVQQHLAEEPTLRLPMLGTLVDLTKPGEVAVALQDVRDMKRGLDELRDQLRDVKLNLPVFNGF